MPAAPVAEPPSPQIVTPPAPTVAPSRPPPQKPPGPPPPTSAPSSDDDLMADSFGDLETISKPKPAPVKAPVKPDETKPKSDFESEVETDKPAEAPKTPEKTGKERSKMATFRDSYDQLKSRNAQLEQEITSIRQGQPQEDPRLKTYMERLEAAEKQREDLESEIRYAAYERSPEYQDKYQKPFEEAYQWGRQSVARLKVLGEDGSNRPGTPEDFDKIMLIQDDSDAVDVAEAMFGNKSKIVLDHRWEMKKLDAQRFRAIEEFRKTGTERQQKTQEDEIKQLEHLGQEWGRLNKEAAERFPKWFKPEEGDKDGNNLLEEGYRLADAAFSNGKGRSQAERMRLHASIRNRAAAFTREVYRNNKLSERVAELEKQIAEYEESVPGPGEGKAEAVADGFEELQPDA